MRKPSNFGSKTKLKNGRFEFGHVSKPKQNYYPVFKPKFKPILFQLNRVPAAGGGHAAVDGAEAEVERPRARLLYARQAARGERRGGREVRFAELGRPAKVKRRWMYRFFLVGQGVLNHLDYSHPSVLPRLR